MKIGVTYGNLKIIGESGKDKHGRKMFSCECLLCGNVKMIKGTYINTGKATSCGCDKNKKISQSKTKHTGKEHPKEYRAWKSMRNRCNNKNYHAYHRYGGRGIKVCGEWSDFDTFLSDMGLSPNKNSQLDRINNDGNYEPENCRWVSPKENSNNREKQKNNTGYTGVYLNKSKTYSVNFYVDRKSKYVGSYPTLQEAVNKRAEAIIKYNKEHNTNLKYEIFTNDDIV